MSTTHAPAEVELAISKLAIVAVLYRAAAGRCPEAIETMNRVHVRAFDSDDVDQALVLMRDLAEFEGYLQDFAVTTEALRERGSGPNPAFGMLVAETERRIVGIAVFYIQPWTYDLRPAVVLKELYVTPSCRSSGVGRRLFEGVVGVAQGMGAPRLTWLVLPHNERAKKFYSSLGGSPDDQWHTWKMAIPEPAALPAIGGGEGT